MMRPNKGARTKARLVKPLLVAAVALLFMVPLASVVADTETNEVNGGKGDGKCKYNGEYLENGGYNGECIIHGDVELNFQKIVCDSYEKVRGNEVNESSPEHDDTNGGYLQWNSTDPERPIEPVEPLPEGCEPGVGWMFELSFDMDFEHENETYTAGPTNETGFFSVDSADLLNETDNRRFRDGEPLWVREVVQEGFEFGALQCYNDALHPDNLEAIELDEPRNGLPPLNGPFSTSGYNEKNGYKGKNGYYGEEDPVWCVAWNIEEEEPEPIECIGPQWIQGMALDNPPRNHIEWDSFAGATGYNLYRAVGGGAFELHATTGANTTEFMDEPVEPGTTYHYRVTAQVGEEETEHCDEVSVTAIPVFPSLIAAAAAAAIGVGAYAVSRRKD